MSICEGACGADGTNLLATGILVLTDQPFTLDERMSEAGQRHLRQTNPWLLVAVSETDREPNACVALDAPASASGIARSIRAGVTAWYPGEHEISVRLWVSPDAGYSAELRPDGPDLAGRAFIWGMGGGFRETDEEVTATYLGPPDLDRCLGVIEAEAARGVTPN